MRKKQKKNPASWPYVAIGSVAAIIAFFLFGIPTAVIPNSYFFRMSPVTIFDYIFLPINSVLFGAFIALLFYQGNYKRLIKLKNTKTESAATGAAFVNVLALGCPICNVVLVSLFSTTALMTYLEPARPALSVLTAGILGTAIYFKAKSIKECKVCKRK